MKVYLVGGAVRDELLGEPTADRDWVVVGASAQEMLDLGYLQVGKDFPVFLHPRTREEYALARRERKTGPGHTGFAIEAAPGVTLEEDLLRRDLTINALAKDCNGALIDPYGGYPDLRQGLLRHVSEAFAEDPLRILRVARFAARFAGRGFRVAPETLRLMTQMTQGGELEHLPAERIWREVETALRGPAPGVFITVLRECGALRVLLPELDALFGAPLANTADSKAVTDAGAHTLAALAQACLLSPDPVVRYAVLVHDVGDEPAPSPLDRIGERLRVPRDFHAAARQLTAYHLQCHRIFTATPASVLELLEALDAFRRPRQLELFILGCEADARARATRESPDYPQGNFLREAFKAASGLDISALLESHQLQPQARDDQLSSEDRRQRGLHIQEVIRQARIQAIQEAMKSRREDPDD